jgi:hypothetical protein
MTGINFLIALSLLSLGVHAQDKYFTKTGKISFYSKAIIENIEAHNRAVTCVLDTKTGNVQFSVPIKGFDFEKALMQEHLGLLQFRQTTTCLKARFGDGAHKAGCR